MKKKKPNQNEKVIPFPGMFLRLTNEGQRALEEKRFDEAVHFYEEALRFDETEKVKMPLLIAYYESGSYNEGIALARDMLHKGEGRYFDVLDLHVLMLIQKRQYNEVADTLSVLLEEGLPADKYEHFARLKTLADRMKERKKTQLFTPEDSIEIKMAKLAELAALDAFPFEEELIQISGNKEEHPFIQTMAFSLLCEIGTAKRITVRKFDFEKEVIPAATNEAFSSSYFLEAIDFLENTVGQSNPVLLKQTTELLKQYAFLLHPFEPDADPESWGQAALRKIEFLYEPVLQVEESSDAVKEAMQFMKELDKFSAF